MNFLSRARGGSMRRAGFAGRIPCPPDNLPAALLRGRRLMRFRAVVLIAVLYWPWSAHAGSEVRQSERFASAALGRDLEYAVYLPPGYAAAARHFPVAYLLHGVDGNRLEYLQDGGLQAVLDGLIAAGRAPPMIVVMPEAESSWYVDSRDVGGPGDYATAIGRELPEHIERTLRAETQSRGRAIGGFSMGGFGALRLAFAQPFRYAAAASLGGAFWTRVTPATVMEDWTDRIFMGSFGRPLDAPRFIRQNPFWMVDGLRGAAGVPAIYLASGDNDRFRAYVATEELHGKLAAVGIPSKLRIIPGDHDWGTWGAALPEVLEFFGAAFGRD
jgi:S-formylglutathione hydrolase FrmB